MTDHALIGNVYDTGLKQTHTYMNIRVFRQEAVPSFVEEFRELCNILGGQNWNDPNKYIETFYLKIKELKKYIFQSRKLKLKKN